MQAIIPEFRRFASAFQFYVCLKQPDDSLEYYWSSNTIVRYFSIFFLKDVGNAWFQSF